MYSAEGLSWFLTRGVFPFGYSRIKACERLPMTFRSCPRPSSLVVAEASTLRPLILANFQRHVILSLQRQYALHRYYAFSSHSHLVKDLSSINRAAPVRWLRNAQTVSDRPDTVVSDNLTDR